MCGKHICSTSRSKPFKSKSHTDVSKCDHIIFSLKGLNIDEIDEIHNLYLIEHHKEYDFNKLKVLFELVFDSNSFSKCITLKVKNNRRRIWFKQFLENVIGYFKNEGYEFDCIEEVDIITIVDKRDRTYQFYMKHNMCSLEWLINKNLDKDKTLMNHFTQDWRHPIDRNYNYYRRY